jgi:hypothetical protein
MPKKVEVVQHEKTLIAYAAAEYSKQKAAQDLDIPRTTFRRKLDDAVDWSKTTAGKRFLKLNGIIIDGNDAPPAQVEIHNKVLLDKLSRMQRDLDRARAENLEADAIRQGIFELANHSPDEPEWVNDRRGFPYHHGVPGLLLSDIHLGEKVYPDQIFNVNEFDTEICHRRIRRVIDTTIHLTHNVLREPQYPGFVLKLGGDNINGIIHEELEIGSDKRFMETIIEIADALHASILKLVSVYGNVYVVGVPGNHGRTTRKPMAKFNAATNADWLVYQMLERFLMPLVAAGKVIFNCPPARDVTYKVAGRRFRLTHGDQFRGGDGMIGFLGPVTRGQHKKLSMALSLPTDNEQFDTMEMGHFHTLHMTPKLIANGSIKGYDEYALSNSFGYEPPQQALYLTHEKYGINHFMPVIADERPELETNPAWVEWQERTEVVNPLSKFAEMLEWASDVPMESV